MLTLNPYFIVTDLYKHRYLIAQLTKRDVLLKYRGSYLGICWSLFYPLVLLLAFTFVFEKIFGTRWIQPDGQSVPFALIMYCGLIVFNIFSEVAGSAPRLIYSYQSYVKKIIFPLEILPVVQVLTTAIHTTINLCILLLAIVLFGKVHLTILLVPVILLPMFLFAFGIAWFLAAAGVYIRDLIHVMPVFVQIFMFLSPVFYAVSIVPEYLQWFYHVNPLSVVIENLRLVALWGKMPDWKGLGSVVVLSLGSAILGYAFFKSGKEEFADVM